MLITKAKSPLPRRISPSCSHTAGLYHPAGFVTGCKNSRCWVTLRRRGILSLSSDLDFKLCDLWTLPGQGLLLHSVREGKVRGVAGLRAYL
ncbi:hypothetical protein R5R35_009066 [Gryllus longicercus]|uniref:Uncharacterized protein n=1 Tax=Gryllus longicercus TaxID=2509291 RepID=A0AAN9V2Y9_9ORTH